MTPTERFDRKNALVGWLISAVALVGSWIFEYVVLHLMKPDWQAPYTLIRVVGSLALVSTAITSYQIVRLVLEDDEA